MPKLRDYFEDDQHFKLIRIAKRLDEFMNMEFEDEKDMTSWFCSMMFLVENSNAEVIDGNAFLQMLEHHKEEPIINKMSDIFFKLKGDFEVWMKDAKMVEKTQKKKVVFRKKPTTESEQNDTLDS